MKTNADTFKTVIKLINPSLSGERKIQKQINEYVEQRDYYHRPHTYKKIIWGY